MAYSLYDSDDENEELLRQNPARPGGGQGSLAGTPSISEPQPQENQQAGSISKFVNFDRLLDANRSSAQSMADRTAGRIEGRAGTLEGSVKDHQSALDRDVQKGTLNYGNEVIEGGIGALNTGGQVQTITYDEAKKRAGSGYAGPQDASSYFGGGLLKEHQDVQSEINATKDLSGLQSMLSREYGKQGHYSEGMGRQDAALTGAVGGQRFRDLQSRYGKFDSLLSDAIKSGGQQIEKAIQTSTDSARKYGGLVSEEDRARAEFERKQAENKKAPPPTHEKDFNEYMGNPDSIGDHSNIGKAAENAAHDVARYTDPTYWLNQLGINFGHAQGQGTVDTSLSGVTGSRRSAMFNPDEADVYNAFTDEEIAELESLPPAEQRARIEAKKKEIRGG